MCGDTINGLNDCSSPSKAVAIVGMAFRFPGDYKDENAFWDALKEGQNLVGKIPSERWATHELQHKKRSKPGRSITFSAGVLSRIDEFDASFFGISPREAAWIDPQQRLLLELAWEAMENAHMQPSSLSGSDCAVYVGISGLDYGTRSLDDLASISSHFMTGNTLSIAANRLSYIFDLHGPSLAIDTACSSSLVALHHACQALHSGEAKAALVGGVNMLLHPYSFVGFTKASMLSADGLCKAFDASGNGYVRAEGGAVLLIKPLEQALADGDDIQAVILATGTNTDGARKTGITIPSREGQIELMKSVLAKTNLSSNDVDFVEAHGTGTSIGDPIETAAIGEVYGKNRLNPLPIGSVKANLGHMEPASGMAGVVKTILSLKNRALAPQIHLENLNPHIDFSGLNIQPVTAYMPLTKEADKPLIAGVNSFGFGGANAHVLLQEYRKDDLKKEPSFEGVFPPLFLSARTNPALKDMASHYAQLLKEKPIKEYYDIAYEAAYRREKMQKRLAVLAQTPEDAVEKLTTYAQGMDTQSTIAEDALLEKGAIAFIYSGNGAQWIGMGRRLLVESQRFSEIFYKLDAKMQPISGFSILNELHADGDLSHMDDTVIAQPLLFAIQVAITLLLKEQGIEPSAVSGHSVGEVAAAWACGALDLENAIRVIVARSTAQGKTRGTGRMAAVGLSAVAMQEFLQELGKELTIAIAGINSPNNITISGNLDDLEHLQTYFEKKGTFFRLLDLDYAFHSPHMDPIEPLLTQSLYGLQPIATDKMTFVSTVTGTPLNTELLDATYWWKNVREPVRFSDAIAALSNLGCHIFIEISPHAILQRYISECLSLSPVPGRVLPTLRKDNDGLERLIETAIRAHLLLETPSLDAYFPIKGNYVQLPNYPWQRERHWHPTTTEGLLSINRRRVHPLLGWPIPEVQLSWENVVDPLMLEWLFDHKIGGAIVFPGAAYAEIALAAAQEWLGGEHLAFEDFDIVSPMVFDGEHARTLHVEINERDGSFQIKSRQRLSHDAWSLHAVGRIIQTNTQVPSSCIEALHEDAEKIDQQTHYQMADQLGLNYGPAFQGLKEAFLYENRVEVTLEAPTSINKEGYFIHPALLDVCYQSLVDFYCHEIKSGHGTALLPVRTSRMEIYRSGNIARFRAHLIRRSARSVVVDFEIFDTQNSLVARLSGCRFRAAPLNHKKVDQVTHWHVIPHLNPHALENMHIEFPPMQTFLENINNRLEAIGEERHKWFKEALPLFEALVLSFTYDAFKAIAQTDSFKNISTSQDPYTLWLMGLLMQENLLLKTEDGSLALAHESCLPESKEIWQTILSEHPRCLPQLTLLGRVGRELPTLLHSNINRLDFLHSINASSVAETLYDEDPAYCGVRHALADLLQQLAETQTYRTLRVLEISAGPTELPLDLIHAFPSDRIHYTLALPDERMAERQKIEYAAFENLSVVTFNHNEWKLEGSDRLSGQFDVILFRHTLHRALHLKTALSQVKNWLCVGGCLLVAERYPDWSADLLFGLDPKWWHETKDTKRPDSSLLSPHAWKDVLKNEGFQDVIDFIEPMSDDMAGGSYLVLAQYAPHDQPVLETPKIASWLLLVDEASANLVERLALWLQTSGQYVEISQQLPLKNQCNVDHIVHLQGWNASADASVTLLSTMLTTVHALALCSEKTPKLWVVTRGGALALECEEAHTINPVQSALFGFGRVIMNEYPSLNCTLIDATFSLDAPEDVVRLGNELLQPDGANEIMLTDQSRYVLIMKENEEKHTFNKIEAKRFRLDFHAPGQLHNLVWLSQEASSIKRDEIEIEVRATGLNFRDVMYLMGLLPDEALENGFAGASLGLEFAGVVINVGSDVETIHMGDKVMGFGSSCFSSHITTHEGAVAKMPEHWSFESAATVPTVFFTVYYSLRHLADLQPNERVLIHGGAGGVGIAAIQLAKYLGAEVFATAGSDEKRAFVELLGADHVFDSRSLSFADEILIATNGEGVDVVLNSLAGEAIRRNLSILKPFGRFLELGKRDFFENTPIGLRPFRNNISYFGIDADQILTGRPQLVARLFSEVMELFYNGVLAPLPCRIFKADHVVDAFRFMQQSRHIGKVVVSLANAHPTVEMPAQEQWSASKSSTWLITGGLSGFGLESARWLVERGASHLVLVSRSGLETPGAQHVLDELSARGIKVQVFSCDITDEKALKHVIDAIKTTMPPLQGVLHAAALYDDALLQNLDATRIDHVMKPKFLGAWNLHQATIDMPLDYFILYSSVTVSIGNPGQANYVSANAALEGLAKMRRQLGLPATCISWGPIGDAGYLTRNAGVLDSLSARMGKEPLSSKQALEALGRTLPKDSIVANFDWNTLSRVLPSSHTSRFSALNRGLKSSAQTGDETDFRTLISGKTSEEVTQIVRQCVTSEVAQILAIKAERIEPLRSLHDMGLDSLMAVELALGLEQRMGIQLPVMMLNDSPTVEKVTGKIVQKLLNSSEEETLTACPANAMVQAIAKQHGELLSEEEIQKIAKGASEMVNQTNGGNL